jgi:hypothetical protein
MVDDDMKGFSKRDGLEPGDYYMSEEGFIVFTAQYLKRRGFCCKSGCRHCPYNYNPKTGKFDREKSQE